MVIDGCTGFGADYAPSNTALTIANLTTQWGTGDTAQGTLTTALAKAAGLINARDIIFAPLNKLVTKVINNFNSTNASAQAKKDAKRLADKIRGFGVKVVRLPDGTPDPAHVSTSHQSFVNKADTFNEFVTFLSLDGNYAPNEVPIKVVTLQALYTSLKGQNDGIGAVIAPVDGARVVRNKASYDAGTGMVDTALKVKNYVKGLYGATSAQARLITRIKFTRGKRR